MNRPGFLAAFFLVKGCSYTQDIPRGGSRSSLRRARDDEVPGKNLPEPLRDDRTCGRLLPDTVINEVGVTGNRRANRSRDLVGLEATSDDPFTSDRLTTRCDQTSQGKIHNFATQGSARQFLRQPELALVDSYRCVSHDVRTTSPTRCIYATI